MPTRRGALLVAREAHNLVHAGSIPVPAMQVCDSPGNGSHRLTERIRRSVQVWLSRAACRLPGYGFPDTWAGHLKAPPCHPHDIRSQSGLWTSFTSGRLNAPLPQMNEMPPQEGQHTKAVVGSDTYPGPVRVPVGSRGAPHRGRSEYLRVWHGCHLRDGWTPSGKDDRWSGERGHGRPLGAGYGLRYRPGPLAVA